MADLAAAVEIVLTYVLVTAPIVLIVRALHPEGVVELAIPPGPVGATPLPPEERDPPRWRLELIDPSRTSHEGPPLSTTTPTVSIHRFDRLDTIPVDMDTPNPAA